MIQIDKPMPQNCYDCTCTNDGFYRCLLADKQLDDDCEDSRPTWCPLHEVTDADTISRQAAYDTLTEYYHHKTDIQHKALAEALSRVPSLSRPQWIPVTERLPEHSCQTLVTTKWDTEYSVEYGFYWGEDNKWGTITNNVIAWMPLPEPYHRP